MNRLNAFLLCRSWRLCKRSDLLRKAATCTLAIASVTATHASKFSSVTGYFYTVYGSRYTALVSCGQVGTNTCKVGVQTVYANTLRTIRLLYVPE